MKRYCALAPTLLMLLGRVASSAEVQLVSVSHVGQLTAAKLSKVKSSYPGVGSCFFWLCFAFIITSPGTFICARALLFAFYFSLI